MKTAFPMALTLLLLGLPPGAASPKVGQTMLPLDSRPPGFTLTADVAVSGEGEQPQAISLHSFLRRKRIIVVFSPAAASLSRRFGRDYEDRDLVLLAVSPPRDLRGTVAVPPLYLLYDEAGAVSREYHAPPGRTTFYLIGKDGTIKMARHDFPSDRELFAVIDAMPMRQQERRGRRRG